MGMELSDLLMPLAALLGGGLASSLGLSWYARRPRGQSILAKVPWWGATGFAILSVSGVVGGFYWFFKEVTAETAGPEALFTSPLLLLGVGLAVGLPFSLPGVLTAWSYARPQKQVERDRKRARSSSQDRLEYSHDLLKQIQDVSPEPRQLSVSVSGEKGKVMVFKGNLARQEGDKLVAALRHDLKDLGFERVEGEGPKGKWWSRV